MANKCIVRNTAYRKGELNLRERHNERKNESHGNGDIDKERSALNVHFKKCESSYEQAFNRLLANETISTRGLGENPKIVDEFVFDVNTKLITYPRTDSRFLTADMAGGIPTLVSMLAKKLSFIASDICLPANTAQVIDNSKVSDHQTIIPTVTLENTDIVSLPAGEKKVLDTLMVRIVAMFILIQSFILCSKLYNPPQSKAIVVVFLHDKVA